MRTEFRESRKVVTWENTASPTNYSKHIEEKQEGRQLNNKGQTRSLRGSKMAGQPED